jgi:hypothetical protein
MQVYVRNYMSLVMQVYLCNYMPNFKQVSLCNYFRSCLVLSNILFVGILPLLLM